MFQIFDYNLYVSIRNNNQINLNISLSIDNDCFRSDLITKYIRPIYL